MKVDVKVAGASYSSVPAILLPLEAGGKARFCEVSDTTAKAADVASGKTFYDANGNFITGTNDGSSGSTETKYYQLTVQQVPHQTITVTCTPQYKSTITGYAASGTSSLDLAATVQSTLQYELSAKVFADSGYLPGKLQYSGNIQNKIITGDVVVTATEAKEIQTQDIPDDYIPVYLKDEVLYQDNSLTTKLTDRSQLEQECNIYIVAASEVSTSFNHLFCPSNKNEADTGFKESHVDFSQIDVSQVTEIGSMFLGNTYLDSADLSGFTKVNAIYSLFSYCTNLRFVYIDSLDTLSSSSLNTYHTLSNCTALEYLVIDNEDVQFATEDPLNQDRGLPSQTKVLVPQAALETYKSHSKWKSIADRILPMENFEIFHSHGVVNVVSREATA